MNTFCHAVASAMLLVVATTSLPAGAGNPPPQTRPPISGYARVIAVQPLYDEALTAADERRCRLDDEFGGTDNYSRAVLAATLIGGIVGGITGNQLGDRSGRTLLTLAGTLLGAAIGHQIGQDVAASNRDSRLSRYHCEHTEGGETREEPVAYRVKYQYRGRTYYTRTDHHPGSNIRIDARLHPIHF